MMMNQGRKDGGGHKGREKRRQLEMVEEKGLRKKEVDEKERRG